MNRIIIILCSLCLCLSTENQDLLNLDEGSNCVWNGLYGVCMNVNNCRSAMDNIRRKIHPPICGFAGITPIVCCTTCVPNDTVRSSTKTPPILVPRVNIYGTKARDNCIKFINELNYPCRVYAGSRILEDENNKEEKSCFDNSRKLPYSPPEEVLDISHTNSSEDQFIASESRMLSQLHPVIPDSRPAVSAGVDAWRNQYPHMALLGYGEEKATAQWLCGGSLISDKYILTAAHCISSPAVGPVKYVALGVHKRSHPHRYWQTHDVRTVIPHPEYRPPSKYHDIALLETELPISFNYQVLPACLHLEAVSSPTANATGWGALGHHRELAETLQTVELQRYDEEKCSELYPKHRHLQNGFNHTTQMCYGHPSETRDTCEGDSGGPLQTWSDLLGCVYTIVGVTSYGRQCGVSAGSGMYTRVFHYVPWIESVVWP